ncbi:MAG TPA: MOSC N-terminal beta barrel domain-containing protein [Vicinamibacterales bacterium]|nr:MOSC N-terminal beta barrel domain-containing protein [Vicinamibacterales bacterium]
MSVAVGSVAGLWRFPVKSMGGERPESIEITGHGIVGDRAFALIDAQTGKVVSAKSVRLYPGLLDCRATFVEPPQAGRDVPAVRITLPDGRSVTSDDARVDRELSAHFKRDVTLARAAPPDYTIDQFHPDIEHVDPSGHRNTFVEQKLGSAFFGELGVASPVPVGAFVDLFPVSVLTTSTLAELATRRPASQFDQRRFRMNVIVDAPVRGFPENEWIGRELAIGDDVRLRIALPDPRCVMTTLPQGDLSQDLEILKTLVRENSLQVGDAGRYPCAGAYAIVEAAGTVRAGDRVAVS